MVAGGAGMMNQNDFQITRPMYGDLNTQRITLLPLRGEFLEGTALLTNNYGTTVGKLTSSSEEVLALWPNSSAKPQRLDKLMYMMDSWGADVLTCNKATESNCGTSNLATTIDFNNNSEILVHHAGNSYVLQPLLLGDIDHNGCLDSSDEDMMRVCQDALKNESSPSYAFAVKYCDLFDFDKSGAIDTHDVEKLTSRMQNSIFACN
jgi:hypothetical protein